MSTDPIDVIINFIANTVEEVETVRKNIHKELVASVIGDTPRDTGMAVRNWQAEKDSIPTSIIDYAGDPDAAAAQAISEAQAKAFGSDGVFYFANNVHYVYYLEYGSSSQAANGMARQNAARIADNLRAQYG